MYRVFENEGGKVWALCLDQMNPYELRQVLKDQFGCDIFIPSEKPAPGKFTSLGQFPIIYSQLCIL